MTIAEECPKCGTDLAPYAALPKPPAFCLQCKFPLMLIAGKYRLERVLGEGGFGTVYLARHIRLTRNAERVVKLIKPDIFQYEGMDKRFFREVQVTSDLSQRNEHIVRIYDDFGEEPHLGHFYVMEYLQGLSLLDYVNKPASLPELGWSLAIFKQLCDAMQAAHEEDIIHRDLKPENLLLIKRRKHPYFVKVLDFGIAKPMGTGGETKLTQGALGTPYYMSPEQTVNRPVDATSDIYSMGIMLYEMLSGRHPFIPKDRENSISAMELMSAHMMQPVPNVCERHPERQIPPGIGEAIIKAAAKEPHERYQSTEEFWQDIERSAGALARVKPNDLPDLLPKALRQTPADEVRAAATNAFAMTAGPEELGPGVLSERGDEGPRSTPGPSAPLSARADAATRDGRSSMISGPQLSRPSSVASSGMEGAPRKTNPVIWVVLALLLLGGVAVGVLVAEKFGGEKTSAKKKSLAAAPAKRATPDDDRPMALRPTRRDDAPDARPDARRPEPTREVVVRRPKPVAPRVVKRRVVRRRAYKRRTWRRRPRPRPAARANPDACPKPGWVRLKIQSCSRGRGGIEVQSSGLPGGKKRSNSVCVPPKLRVSIDQSRCAACIFNVPAAPAVRSIFLKNPDEVDFDTGRGCLNK